jgi:hypothetical protein
MKAQTTGKAGKERDVALTCPTYKRLDVPICLPPHLGARAVEMRIEVTLILELVSEEPSRVGICQDSDGVPQT